MAASPSESFRFWHVGGPQHLHFGHLHGTPIDLALISSSPTLRTALMAEAPTLRIAVVAEGKVERLLDKNQVASLIGMLPDSGAIAQ
jgi:hypothetical protein